MASNNAGLQCSEKKQQNPGLTLKGRNRWETERGETEKAKV